MTNIVLNNHVIRSVPQNTNFRVGISTLRNESTLNMNRTALYFDFGIIALKKLICYYSIIQVKRLVIFFPKPTLVTD